MKNSAGFVGVIPLILFLILLISIPVGMYLVSQRTNIFSKASTIRQSNSTNTNPQQKNIITIQKSETPTFYSYNLVSKQSTEILKLQGSIIHETAVSPDGQKLYYISSNNLINQIGFGIFVTNSITVMTNDNQKKEYKLTGDNSWSLFNPGILDGGGIRNCYWSPDSTKLACMLIQREGSGHAGTGRSNIMVLDFSNGSTTEAFDSNQITQDQRAVIDMVFSGWVGNNKLLVANVDDSIASLDIQPADFYIVDIATKTPQKEFSLQYSRGLPLTATPKGDQIFIDSFSRVNEEKLVLYNLASKQFVTILSTKDTLSISEDIVPSEDGTKMVYSTILDQLIHIYDLSTNKETTVNVPNLAFSIQALLLDNKTFVIQKVDNSSLFDINTKEIIENLKGVYIGSGNF